MSTDESDILTGMGARVLVERMGEAVANVIASLTPQQRAKATFDFDEQEERTRWFYTPVERAGLPLAEMERHQERLVHRLVAAGLSRAGYVTASTIMGLESTLDALEQWHGPGRGRDPRLYYLSIFGQPDAARPWGWRFEGHHISLNYTIVEGRIISPTPTFFGANPADAALSGAGTLRPLAGVEDLARELLHALGQEQRATALLSTVAPADIVTRNDPHVSAEGLDVPGQGGMERAEVEAVRYTAAPKGLPGAKMSAAQREILMALIGEYIHRMPDELAEIEARKLEQQGVERLHFAWAGGLERHQPHYYRLHGVRFLVEYDNTQNNANHIHSVWRDPANDFGAHLLEQHYARAHRSSRG